MAREDHGCICFVFVFCMCSQQKSKHPQFEPKADDAINQGGTPGVGSPLYICGMKIYVKYSCKTRWNLTACHVRKKKNSEKQIGS